MYQIIHLCGTLAKLRRFICAGEFSVATLMTSEYDLKEASKKFRFVMHPKVQSELQPLQVAEFMANDEQSYKLWVKAIGRVIRCLEELDANPTVEATMR